MPEATDDALLAAIAQGSTPAFRALMERHGRFALALAQRMTGNASDADEVVQEAFLRVWTSAGRWRADGGARFTTWLYRVVFNLCADRRRNGATVPLEEAAEMKDTAPGGLEMRAAGEGKTLLAEALRGLPERQRRAVTLYYFGELSVPEISRTLGVSIYALESLLARARRSIRKFVGERGLNDLGDLL